MTYERLINDMLTKKKPIWQGESEQDLLFMAHIEVLKLTERYRLIREGKIVGYTRESEVPH